MRDPWPTRPKRKRRDMGWIIYTTSSCIIIARLGDAQVTTSPSPLSINQRPQKSAVQLCKPKRAVEEDDTAEKTKSQSQPSCRPARLARGIATSFTSTREVETDMTKNPSVHYESIPESARQCSVFLSLNRATS